MGICFSQEPKVIAVVGATGAQGGGLVRAILDDKNGGFTARALTRDPSKESAQGLKEKGAEVVAFDLDKPETMADALQGAYGLFVVTNYWEHMDVEKEKKQVQDIVKAGKEAGVEHFVWSTLEDTTPFFDSLKEEERPPKIKGFYVPHFDGKGQANAFFPKESTTFLYTSFYLENFYNFGMVTDGVASNNVGDAKFPSIAVEDIGKCAYGIFKAGNQYKGKSVYIAGDCMTFAEMMEICSKVTGKKFSYKPVDRATYAGFGFPGADDLSNMFEYNRLDKAFAENRNVTKTKSVNKDLQNVEQWAKSHKEELLKVAPKDS